MCKISQIIYSSVVLIYCVSNVRNSLLEVPRGDWITKSDRSPKIKKYIDIYTNHEDVQEVIASYYKALRSDTNKSQQKQPDNIDSPDKSVQERRGYYKPTDYALTNGNSDKLQSDFGIFTSEADRLTGTSNMFTPSEEIYPSTTNGFRPISEPQNYDSTLENYETSSYIQKIPKRKNDSNNVVNDTKERIHTLLRHYLKKLYSQKYANNHNNRNDKKLNFNDVEGGSEGKIFWNELSSLKNKTVKLATKFFSLFHVVQFPNSICTVRSGSTVYIGTCYPSEECGKRGGTAMGNCADGYGVCCVFRYSCGQSSSQNCSYFESPGYPDYTPPDSSTLPPTLPPPTTTTQNPSPTPDPRKHYYYYYGNTWSRSTLDGSLSCSFNVFKASDDIQQMRIDFEDLELMGPTNGTCVNERLVISGQNVNDQVPVICGYNTGQHVYVDVSMLNGPLMISVLSNMASRKRYKLRICQLSTMCSNLMNCLQYYTGVTGVISSFNYDQAAMYNRSTPGYFNNLNYAICIRKEAGYCSVTYTNVQNDREYPFELVNQEESGVTTVAVGRAGVGIYECPDDYIVIDGIRLCGYKLNDGTVIDDSRINAPVRDTSAGPIVIPVRTNQNVTGRGFKLFYTQNVCPTQMNRYVL